MKHIKPEWVIFDVGGVIFDYQSAFAEIAKYLEIEKEHIADRVAEFQGDPERGGILFEEILQRVLADLQKAHEYEKVSKMWWDIQWFLSGTRQLARDLKQAGYKLAFLTNNWAGMGDRILQEMPEFSMIDMLFESSKEGLRKPEMALYQLVENRTGATGSSIYFIDDSPKFISAAKERDWQTFLYELGTDKGESANKRIREYLLP